MDFIKVEKVDSIGKIILNCPDKLNIIEPGTFEEIHSALDEFEKNDVKIVLITANCGTSRKGKKVFSAGVNLKKYDEEKINLARTSPEKFKEELKTSRSLIERIEVYDKPVVIGIDGFVTGGFFELALGCDAILATNSAAFSLNEVNIGIIPGYGGIYRLLRLAGKNRTFEIIVTGRILQVQEAYELGIVTQVVEDFEEYCRNLAGQSEPSLKFIKQSIRQILQGENIEEVELENFIKAVASKDAEKRINFFLNRNRI